MALTTQLVAEIVRQRLGQPDGRNSARIILLIPDALRSLARKIAAHPHLRGHFLSDKSTGWPIETDGTDRYVELAPIDEALHILREYLDFGQIYVDHNQYPLQKLASPSHGKLPQQLTDFGYYYAEGNRLYLSGVGDDAANAYFAVPTYPATLADLPPSGEIEKLLIDKLCELATLPANDYAQDGSG